MTSTASPAPPNRSISILRDPAFGRLWFVQAATQVGGNMALYALTILVFASTRSNAAVSALVMSFLLPTIALSAVAGVVVDRLNLRWALVGPNIVRAVLTLGLALAGANVPVLLLLNLGISFTTVMLTPAEAAMIPRIVGREQLETAMGVFNLTLQASFGIGFAFLGPLLVTVAGPSFVLGVVTVLYIAATLACLALPSSPPAPLRRASRPGAPRAGPAAPRGIRRDPRESRGGPAAPPPGGCSVPGRVLGVLGPALAASIGLEPDQLVVVVLPLGLGVIAGVLGLRRFGQGVQRRQAAEAGLSVSGSSWSASPRGAGSGSRRSPGTALTDLGPAIPIVVILALCAGLPTRSRPSRLRPHSSSTCRSGTRSRVRRACLDRERDEPPADPHRRAPGGQDLGLRRARSSWCRCRRHRRRLGPVLRPAGITPAPN